ncbi:hypothetical protein B0I37DRAFT_440986 [Chaetomium sp. MPI-CAGE-AT-0009]|nr:hypothetical protein B0I37DRAFT_440986 [Chaetomium sp. MPI-CAGE-AT-0009]
MSFQTPGGPAAKRRRIEAANATLRKPFRSPLVSRQQTEPGADSAPSPSISRTSPAASFTPHTPVTPAPGRGGHRPVAASPLFTTSPSPTTTSTPGLLKRHANLTSKPNQSPITTTSTPNPPNPPNRKPKPNPNNNPDPEKDTPLLQQIHLSQTALTTSLRATQARLDLVRQARRIEEAAHAKRPGEPVDAELRAMAARWKATSRLAADELFGLIRGRVEGMGGARAWRGTRRVGRGWEEDRDAEEEEEEEEEESGETEFTMMMMLKSLNIEPEVLGYDPVEDKWRD